MNTNFKRYKPTEKERKELYYDAWIRGNRQCASCGKSITQSEIHHATRDRIHHTYLIPLCWTCHTAIHDRRISKEEEVALYNRFFDTIFARSGNKIIPLT